MFGDIFARNSLDNLNVVINWAMAHWHEPVSKEELVDLLQQIVARDFKGHRLSASTAEFCIDRYVIENQRRIAIEPDGRICIPDDEEREKMREQIEKDAERTKALHDLMGGESKWP